MQKPNFGGFIQRKSQCVIFLGDTVYKFQISPSLLPNKKLLIMINNVRYSSFMRADSSLAIGEFRDIV